MSVSAIMGHNLTVMSTRFAKEHGFTLIKSSPYHSQGNGKAESTVKVAKNILKKSRHEDPYLALLAYRNTPTGICLLYSTKINVTKTAGHHSHGSKSTSTATTSFRFGSSAGELFLRGDKVFVKPNSPNKHNSWVYGEVIGNYPAPRTCLVSTPLGPIRRHHR